MPTDSPDLQSPPEKQRRNHIQSRKHPILPTFPCLLKVGADLKMGVKFNLKCQTLPDSGPAHPQE